MDLLDLVKTVIYAGAAVICAGMVCTVGVFIYMYHSWAAGDFDDDK